MGKNVLLVEDDRNSRESLAYLLKGLGHVVHAFWTAEDAKAFLQNFSPDIALLDMRLPGLPGDAFVLYLKHKFPHIKIVFVSGDFLLDQPERFGPDVDFLPKPLDFNRLLAALDE